tara:strand:+ start:81 stop:482 length:402 start_codon:yes stop_codon:yes gene_type:complete
MTTKNVITELDTDNLKNIIQQIDTGINNYKGIIIKFGATWCGPCQRIKKLCDKLHMELSDDILYCDIDIDDNVELYVALKSKKMINGVPTLLAYVKHNNRDMNSWYASDLSVLGSDTNNITNFFTCIKNYKPK